MKEQKKGKKKKPYGIYFLALVILLYLVLFIFKPGGIRESLLASAHLLIRIIPVLLLVVLFMGIMNYFVHPKTVSKHLGQGSGITGWVVAISAGILSHGPIYVWYPLLRELHEQGMRTCLVAAFLYNRGIKIPLLPLMIHYFGAAYVVILLFFMIIASIVEGKIIEMGDRFMARG